MCLSGGVIGPTAAAVARGSEVARGSAVARSSAVAAVAAVKSEYRAVALAEYFGSAGQVCSALTVSGVRAYTRGQDSCAVIFRFDQRSLNAKYGGASASFGARTWRAEVAAAVAGLKVDVRGHRATAVDATHVFKRTTLVEVVGKRPPWLADLECVDVDCGDGRKRPSWPAANFEVGVRRCQRRKRPC
jgi:hypothetical protein